MNFFKSILFAFFILVFNISTSHALVIGTFFGSRNVEGLTDFYMANARQSLFDQGHELRITTNVTSSFLSGVDAFYTGLFTGLSGAETSALTSFVNNDGGFLFVQQDHNANVWHGPANALLSQWGIGTSGLHTNDANHFTAGSSDWVTNPNLVSGGSGSAHSVISQIPSGLNNFLFDSFGQPIMGALEAEAGRSGTVLVSTDIDLFSNQYGWTDTRNQELWENIWSTAELRVAGIGPVIDGGSGGGSGSGAGGGTGGGSIGGGTGGNGTIAVSEPSNLFLFGLGFLALLLRRRYQK